MTKQVLAHLMASVLLALQLYLTTFSEKQRIMCMKEGPVTLFKVSGDLKRCFVAEGVLVRNTAEPDLCRTQQVIQLSDPSQASCFLTDPIGNHHIVIPGHISSLLLAVASRR